MGIFHRTSAANFAGGHRTAPTWTGHDWGWGHSQGSDARASERGGGITSYPWEGLFLEGNQATEPAGEAASQPSTRLGQFLTSLMYGE